MANNVNRRPQKDPRKLISEAHRHAKLVIEQIVVLESGLEAAKGLKSLRKVRDAIVPVVGRDLILQSERQLTLRMLHTRFGPKRWCDPAFHPQLLAGERRLTHASGRELRPARMATIRMRVQHRFFRKRKGEGQAF